MSYIQKNTRVFQNDVETKTYKVRSESRMKNYASSIDSRAWSDVMEDRKQHILENLAKNKIVSSPSKLIPINYLVEAMVASKNERLKQLKMRTEYMERLLDIYSQLGLTTEQEKQFAIMKSNLENTNAELSYIKREEETHKDPKSEKETQKDKKSEEETHKDKKILANDEQVPNDKSLEILKIFESNWMDLKTDRTPCSEMSLDYEPSSPRLDVTCKVIFDTIKHKTIIEGIVTLSKPTTPRFIPGGYYAGADISLIDRQIISEEDIDDFVQIVDENRIDIEVPEANDVPKLVFEEFLESDLSSDELYNKKEAIEENNNEKNCVYTETSNIGDSVLTQTYEEIRRAKDQPAQTDDYSKLQIRSCIRSPSCPCLNQHNRKLTRTASNNQIGIISKKQRLRQQETEIRISEEKCCGTDNYPDTYDLCKKRYARLFENRYGRLDTEHQIRCAVMNDSKEDLLIHKNVEIIAFKDALKAKESYCAEQKKHAAAALEQLDNIKNVVEERDDLRKKLEHSQEELEQLKKNIELSKSLGIHHEVGSETERDIDSISSCSLTPKSKAKVITRDMQVIRKFSSQLINAQKENSNLKEKLSIYENLLNKLGVHDFSNAYIEELKFKFEYLEETVKERNNLRNRVETLENELCSFNYLPEDIEVFKQRSLLLDDVLHDRDRLSKRVEQLRGLDEEVINLKKKASRLEKLEDDLRKFHKEKKLMEEELDHMRSKCSLAEIEVFNHRAEGDTLRSKLVCMQHEIENLKCASIDNERLKNERDYLKKSVDELGRMQGDFEHMKKQMKCLEILKAEKDIFKSKYEDLVGLECECDILRMQVEKAKIIENERDALENQVEDLEGCVAEQEAEIRRLVCHIDILAKGRDDEQDKLKQIIINMRAELEKKDTLMISAEEKLAMLQRELSNSIQGLSTETIDLKYKNEKLEKQIENSEHQMKELKENISQLLKDNETLTTRINDLVDDNNFLMNKLEEKENSLDTLKEVLQDHEVILEEFQKSQIQLKENSRDTETETDALDLIALGEAKVESKNIEEKLTKISTIAGDKYLQNLLVQSKQAVQKIAQELEKQYKDWDCFKIKLKGNENKSTLYANKDVYTVGYCYSTEVTDGVCTSRGEKSTGRDTSQEVYSSTNEENQDNSSGKDALCATYTQTYIPGDSTFKYEKFSQTETKMMVDKFVATSFDSTEDIKNDSFEYDITKWVCFQADPKDSSDSPKENPTDEVEAFESARSVDCVRCQNIGERLQMLEKELSSANDTILDLQDKMDRVTAENSALRRHSTEVQEVAKDQIKDLVGHIKDTKERCSYLEKETDQLVQNNCVMLLEKSELLNVVKDLQNQKEDLEKLLASNIVTNTRRSTAIENDLESLKKENTDLKLVISRIKKVNDELTACQDENHQLREDLNKTKLESINSSLIKSLELENEKLTLKVDTQMEEISELLEKIKTPSLPEQFFDSSIDRERETLKSIIDDLENQLKGLEKITAIEEPSKQLDETINNLTRRLEDTEKRAEKAETALCNLKASHPGAMLTAEIEKLKQKIFELEEENKKINDAVLVTNLEFDSQKTELQAIQSKAQKSSEENNKLQNELNECLRKMKEENEVERFKLKQSQYEKEIQNNANELKNSYNKISKLQQEIGNLKQELLKSYKEGGKLKKDMQSAHRYEQNEKLEQLEKEKNKYLKEKLDLEIEISRLKKEIDDALNSATLSSARISELQGETAKLKQNYEKLENDNAYLKRDLETAIAASRDSNEQLNQTIIENNMLKTANAEAGDQLIKLKNELDNAVAEARKFVDDNEFRILTHKLSTYEAKNNKLKQDLEFTISSSNDRVAKLLQNVANLETEKEKLKTELNNKKTEKDDGNLKTIIDELETDNKKLTKEISKALDDLIKANNTVIDNKNEVTKIKLKMSLLESENDKLKKDFNEVLDSTKKTNSELLKLKDHESVLKQRLAQLESENLKLKNDFDNSKVANKSNSSVVQNLKDQINRHKSELCNLKQENAKFKKELEIAIKDKSNKDDTEIWKQKASQFEDHNRKLKEEIADYKNTVNKLSHMQDENSNLQQKILDLEKDNENLKNQCKGAMGDSKKSMYDLEKIKTNEEKMKELASQLQDQNTNMKEEISVITNNLTECRIEINSLNLKNDILQKENNKYKEDLKELSNIQQLKTDITILKQRIAQLETENIKLKTEYDNMIAFQTKRELVSPTGDSKLTAELTQLEEETKQLKTDLNNALNEAKKYAELQEIDMKLKQQIAALENENVKIKRELEKSLQYAEKGTTSAGQLKEENFKMKEKIKQLENEIASLTRELNNALEYTKKGVTGITEMQENDAKQKQKIFQLEKDLVKLRKDLEVAVINEKSNNEVALQLRSDNDGQKQLISELKEEITRLKNSIEGIQLQDEISTKLNELEKDNYTLKNNLEDAEQIKNDNKKLKDKLQLLEIEIEKYNKNMNGVIIERNKLIADLTKIKENEACLKRRVAELESTNSKLKQGVDSSSSGTKFYQKIEDENACLSKKLRELEHENKILITNIEKALKETKNKSQEIDKLKEDTVELKQKTAELEKANAKLKANADAFSSHLLHQKRELVDNFNKEKEIVLQKCEEDINKLKKGHEEFIRDLNKKQEKDTKVLKDMLNKAMQELQDANNNVDKLKNLLGDQKRKSKDIKGKVDQVETLIINERQKNMEEQMKNKGLEAQIDKLNEELGNLKKQLEEKTKKKPTVSNEKMPDVITITPPITEKEMEFYGKPSSSFKPNFHITIKKLAEGGLESLTADELQILNNKLAETTADRLAKMGQNCGVLKPNEDNKLALLKKIASLEGDLVKKQKHAQQKVVAMQYAVKLEKDRLIELKKKLDEERMKNKQLLTEMGLQSQPVSEHILEGEDLIQQEQKMIHHTAEKLSGDFDKNKHVKRREYSSNKIQEKNKPKSSVNSEMLLKMKMQEERLNKRCHRCHSPSSTPVKDINGPSSSAKLSFYTSFGPDKTPKTLYTKGMPSSPCNRPD